MNTALGGQGTWPETADPKDYPVQFEIDYVRYYTRKDGAADAAADADEHPAPDKPKKKKGKKKKKK
jgi:hypothetical protein